MLASCQQKTEKNHAVSIIPFSVSFLSLDWPHAAGWNILQVVG
jgi:hypothetical protein